jgi:hypothetical protein
MPLLGKAAVAMWWDVTLARRAEFEEWHAHEHFPERLGVPGFLRASRWGSATGGEGYFVMYELDALETLTSHHYLERLNSPTAWSTRMMPQHRNMVRSLCAVMFTFGGGVARSMFTVRLSPQAGAATALLDRLREVLPKLPVLPGITGAHLLQTQAATPGVAMTAEQRMRGRDGAADWILLLTGYDAQAVAEIASSELGASALAAAGAQSGSITGLYELRYTLTPADL